MAIVRLKPGREKSVLRRHPWIYSGAVSQVEGVDNERGIGETVDVVDSRGDFLARGAYSPNSQIRIRIWTWDPEEVVGEAFFRERLTKAMGARDEFVDLTTTNAYRLVNAESDGLPGLIVDRYADTLVIQCLSSGPERWRETLVKLISEISECSRIYERSDVEIRGLEGLVPRVGVLIGTEVPQHLKIEENGTFFEVDLRHGHKTGFYLDQRENRARLKDLVAGRIVLDCFSYSGGFTVMALAGNAEKVITIDSSEEVLGLARQNIALNGLPMERVEWVKGDVFRVLREYRDQGRSFDLVILDPPKFASTSAHIEGAARGYKDINLLAFKLLTPGGILVTFSCSGGVHEELFQKIVAGAALDAGVNARIVERLHQGPDHPVALNFPEGSYLKGFIIQI